MSEKKEKINTLIDSSFQQLNNLIDVNTVIGKPFVTASGFQIIPFSKISFGNLSGGGEYGDAKIVKETESFPFAGGNGAVMSMKPLGFLIDDGKSCHIQRITDEPIDNLIERVGEILRDVLAKK